VIGYVARKKHIILGTGGCTPHKWGVKLYYKSQILLQDSWQFLIPSCTLVNKSEIQIFNMDDYDVFSFNTM
jgi:hypothetical protein